MGIGEKAHVGPSWFPSFVRQFIKWMTFGEFEAAAFTHDIKGGVDTDLTRLENDKLFLKNLDIAVDRQHIWIKRKYLNALKHIFYRLVRANPFYYEGDEIQIKVDRTVQNLADKIAELEEARVLADKARAELYANYVAIEKERDALKAMSKKAG